MCTGQGSNQGPLGPKSDALTTAPLCHLQMILHCKLSRMPLTYLSHSWQISRGLIRAYDGVGCELILTSIIIQGSVHFLYNIPMKYTPYTILWLHCTYIYIHIISIYSMSYSTYKNSCKYRVQNSTYMYNKNA